MRNKRYLNAIMHQQELQKPFYFTSQLTQLKQNHQTQEWTIFQELLYARFLCRNASQLKDGNKSQTWKFYMLMAEHIPNRNPNQCRIKQRRMLKLYGSNQAIIAASKDRIFQRWAVKCMSKPRNSPIAMPGGLIKPVPVRTKIQVANSDETIRFFSEISDSKGRGELPVSIDISGGSTVSLESTT